jgi:hypothetical protein
MLRDDPSPDNFDRFVRDILIDCKGFVEHRESIRIPSFELSLCDNSRFQDLLRLRPRRFVYEPIAITAGRGTNRLIAINVEKVLLLLQNENPHETLVLNLALAAIEELIHTARPELSETQVSDMVNDLGEEYLEFEIPQEVRERLARIVAENEAAANERSR